MPTVSLIQANQIVTDPRLREKGLVEGAIAVLGSTIEAIGPLEELRRRFPDARLIGSDRHLALPGFIDAHNHGQGVTTFSQGLRDEKLELWSILWPRLLNKSDEFSYLDSLIAAARQIRSGVTSTMPKRMDSPPLPLDEYWTEVIKIIEAYETSGMRLTFAVGTTDKASQFVYIDNNQFIESLPEEIQRAARQLSTPKNRITLEECIDQVIGELCFRYKDTDLVNVAVAITGPQWLSDDFLLPLANTAKALNIPLHGPMIESPHQKMYAEETLGCSVVEHLAHHNLLDDTLSIAHGVWLNKQDMELLAAAGATVIHCPSSNLRFRGGISPVGPLLAHGVNVALAVDSEGINDDDDTFQEMRLAKLLHRIPGSSYVPDEWDILAMATVNGARALMMEDQIGTITIGKQADIILIDMDQIFRDYLHPDIGTISALVQRGKVDHIDFVLVAGKIIYQEGEFARFDYDEVRNKLNDIMQNTDWSAGDNRMKLVNKLLPYVRDYYQNWELTGFDPVYKCNSSV